MQLPVYRSVSDLQQMIAGDLDFGVPLDSQILLNESGLSPREMGFSIDDEHDPKKVTTYSDSSVLTH